MAQALLKTGAYLNAILDYDLLLDSILEQATLFFPFDLAAIMLLEADQVRVERIRVADAAESLQWAIDKAAQALFPLPTTKICRK
ncbi:MAG: hypothetical protein M5U34_08830 [Chloroflexi bacterium]|nr:hypothetical protein [Chloroflexota bacterium]